LQPRRAKTSSRVWNERAVRRLPGCACCAIGMNVHAFRRDEFIGNVNTLSSSTKVMMLHPMIAQSNHAESCCKFRRINHNFLDGQPRTTFTVKVFLMPALFMLWRYSLLEV
jgi:hypothetical protein